MHKHNNMYYIVAGTCACNFWTNRVLTYNVYSIRVCIVVGAPRLNNNSITYDCIDSLNERKKEVTRTTVHIMGI